jgi:hypothetical protein
MTESSVCVVNVVTPEGAKDYVALTSANAAFSGGLVPEAILGILKRPLIPEEPITPDIFIPNSVFSKFLADVIARYGPEDADLQAEAARIGQGSVVLVDCRTPTPEGPVPPEDIIGVFQVEDGKVLPGSYLASPNHKLLTTDGFFRLNRVLTERLQQELTAQGPNRPKSTDHP